MMLYRVSFSQIYMKRAFNTYLSIYRPAQFRLSESLQELVTPKVAKNYGFEYYFGLFYKPEFLFSSYTSILWGIHQKYE